MNHLRKVSVLALIAAGALSLAACDRKDETTAPSTESATLTAVPDVTPEPTPSTSSTLDNAKADASAAAADIKDSVKEKSAEAGAKLDDAGITTKVKAALAKNAGLSTLKLNVTTNGGVVTLEGNVDSEAKQQEVVNTVTALEGVTSVNNQLVVKPK
ncbi:Osmotically-inducible protein Y [Andreprevotia sp. IGB-42]|uniref:BON domain-containing protein n=1 Tax=Andreprevotia sp. IGB-42 TaxID=2497473 RepID=UPI00135AF8DB|nr:BON domain-containing protein [Andreprevotia sp. IGB-42]KAF0813340.1 Osmotically-inducible protein Y [Andreprevotia sp. IGB-42]